MLTIDTTTAFKIIDVKFGPHPPEFSEHSFFRALHAFSNKIDILKTPFLKEEDLKDILTSFANSKDLEIITYDRMDLSWGPPEQEVGEKIEEEIDNIIADQALENDLIIHEDYKYCFRKINEIEFKESSAILRLNIAVCGSISVEEEEGCFVSGTAQGFVKRKKTEYVTEWLDSKKPVEIFITWAEVKSPIIVGKK